MIISLQKFISFLMSVIIVYTAGPDDCRCRSGYFMLKNMNDRSLDKC